LGSLSGVIIRVDYKLRITSGNLEIMSNNLQLGERKCNAMCDLLDNQLRLKFLF